MNVIRTDVVGGVQAIAETWLKADDDLRDWEKEHMRVTNQISACRTRKEEAAKRLAERVGPNISTRVFVVGKEAVVVDHERSIKRVPIEKDLL